MTDSLLPYLRRYLSDPVTVRIPQFQLQAEVTVTPDSNVTYFRQYLGRI